MGIGKEFKQGKMAVLDEQIVYKYEVSPLSWL